MLKYLKILFIALLVISFSSCTSKSEKKQTEQEILLHQSAANIQNYLENLKIQQKTALSNYIETMSLEEKISQLFIENLEGDKYFRTFEDFGDINSKEDSRPLIAGGYLFFSANLANRPQEVMLFTNSIYDFCKKNNIIPPFLAIDQEGGFVNRLKNLSGPLPSCQRVSSCISPQTAYELYSLQAEQMKLLGFSMNLAPIAEICTPDNSLFLNERSFGSSSQVKLYGRNCMNAFQDNGISAVLKHFPGNTNTDPHTGLPEITLSKNDLDNSLEPFYHLLAFKPHGILMSHALTAAYNPELPSCLSSFWVTDILRNKYGYEGLIFSDDIFMGALAKNGYPPEKAVIMAIEAGIDCIMTSERRFSRPAKYLYQAAKKDSALEEKINIAVSHVLLYKIEIGLLEYSYQEQSISINVSDNFVKAVDEARLKHFEEVKDRNTQFYIEHFTSE
ncbi:MAG: glycoside hydrolase family 3 protein [Treponema sp.]|nr:glycoside hydrolase family 3 protein [Treponema sp.]